MIHAFPGMGADQRMYPGPWLELPELSAGDWTPAFGEQTLADVARVMCNARSIRDGDALIGCSLGGMVACEITKIRHIPALYLIGSAVSPSEVSGLLSVLRPLARVAPLDWIRVSAGKIPTECAQMFAGTDPAFIRAMCSAIFEWKGLGATRTKVFRIHGKEDLVIPAPEKVDLLLEGGHLISMTHAHECVDFVRAHQASHPTLAFGRRG